MPTVQHYIFDNTEGLTVGGTSTLNGATGVNNTLTVSGITKVNSELSVSSNTKVGGTLNVTGDTTLSNNSITGTLGVTNATTLNGTVDINAGTSSGDTDTFASIDTAGERYGRSD